MTLVGRNGAGKTTLLRCLMGLHGAFGRTAGTISLSGDDVTALAPHARARRGLGYVPDDRGIFATLSVEENLTLAPVRKAERRPAQSGRWSGCMRRSAPEGAAPVSGTTLSGGEQQMLVLARVLRTAPAPAAVRRAHRGPVAAVRPANRRDPPRGPEEGATVLLVEQNVHFASLSPIVTICSPRGGSSSHWTATRCVNASINCSNAPRNLMTTTGTEPPNAPPPNRGEAGMRITG